MELMASVLGKMKTYLISLNYPNINVFTEDDIIRIFSPKNRIKLLMWALNQLSDSIAIPLEEDAQILYMSDIVYEWGFCKLTEKTAFVKCELEIQEQFVIFSRLFWFLLNKEPRTSAIKQINYEDIMKMAANSSVLKKKVQKSISIKSYDEQRKEIAENLIRLQNQIDELEIIEEFDLPQLKPLKIDLEDNFASFSTNLVTILESTSDNRATSVQSLELCGIGLDKTVSSVQNTVQHLIDARVVSGHKEMLPLNKSGIADDWCDKNIETLQKMLHKYQLGKDFTKQL